jgi:hypothetical protein
MGKRGNRNLRGHLITPALELEGRVTAPQHVFFFGFESVKFGLRQRRRVRPPFLN